MTATRRFRELLNRPGIIRSLGAHDVFTARLIGAEEAASIGLLNEVVEDVSTLVRRVEELAKLIAGNSPPNQPLPIWYGRLTDEQRTRVGNISTSAAAMGP